MKRKEIAKKLAIMVLGATMVLPMAPVSAFAADQDVSVEASDTVVNENTIDDDNTKTTWSVNSVERDGLANATQKDKFDDDVNTALESLNDTTNTLYTISTAVLNQAIAKAKFGTSNTGAAYTATATNVVVNDADNQVVATFVVTATATDGATNTITGTRTYKVVLDKVAGVISNAQAADKLAEAVEKAIKDAAGSFDYEDKDGTINQVKKIVDGVMADPNNTNYVKVLAENTDNHTFAHTGSPVTYDVALEDEGSEDSDTENRGTIAIKVTLNYPASAKGSDAAKGKYNGGDYAGESAFSKEVKVVTERAYAPDKLTKTQLHNIIDWIQKLSTVDNTTDKKTYFQNDVTAEQMTARVQAYIDYLAKSDDSYKGVVATVSNLRRLTETKHGMILGNVNTINGSLTLAAGGNSLTEEFTTKVMHADEEKLSELDAAITEEAGKIEPTKIQKTKATEAASDDDIKDAVVKAVNKAIASKVNDVALNDSSKGDGWNKITADDVVVTDVTPNCLADAGTTTGNYRIDDSEYTGTAEQKITAAVAYTKSTPATAGKAVVTVTEQIPDHEKNAVVDLSLGTSVTDKDYNKTKTTTFTIDFGTLKEVKSSYMRFSQSSVEHKYHKDDAANVASGTVNGYSYTEKTGNNKDKPEAGDYIFDPISMNYVKYNGTYQLATGTKLYTRAAAGKTNENTDGDRTFFLGTYTADGKEVPFLQHDGNDVVTYSSSNPSAVAVDQDGHILIKGEGAAVITATDGTNSATITVNGGQGYVFKDVQDPDMYYFKPVAWAYENNITSGLKKDEFGINAPVTRAQFVTWLYKEAGAPNVDGLTNSFTDVSETKYYNDAVKWAFNKGITSGTSATTFSPNETITREQAVTMLYKAFGGGVKYDTPADFFDDVPEERYSYDAIVWAYNKGVTAGKTQTKFAPKDTITRKEGVTFLYSAR